MTPIDAAMREGFRELKRQGDPLVDNTTANTCAAAMNKIPTRERCACCNRISALGFHVPDEVWLAAVPKRFYNDILCFACFADFADAQLIEWDRNIKLFPVSLVGHYIHGIGLSITNTEGTYPGFSVERTIEVHP